ncbi:MAG: Uma2 family endonuclease [Merismopedia sp. SIO2A8]|nr:Uma2 family endonuclease [Merismopedia sp. SIO2A8]
MTSVVSTQIQPALDNNQHFIFPQKMSWERFKAFDHLTESYALRLSYFDGYVELMSISPEHETIKCLLSLLLGLYFLEFDLSFTPTGSATIEQPGSVSKEPDLSYRFGDDRRQQDVPDLVIEIIFTSGGIDKLSYYQHVGIPEVWFWEDGVFSLYCLEFRSSGERHGNDLKDKSGNNSEESSEKSGAKSYVKVDQSVALPQLDMQLLARCLSMAEEKEALKQFRNAIRR